MLVLVIVLSILLFVTVCILAFYLLVGRRYAKRAFNDLMRAASLSGVDLASDRFQSLMQKVSNDHLKMERDNDKLMREETRHRCELITFMKMVKEFQAALAAAPGIHVRKDMVLEFLGDIARHFKLEHV